MSRKIVIAAALITIAIAMFLVWPAPVDAPEGATAGTTAVAALPAASPMATSTVSDRVPEPSAPVDGGNAQDATPDYIYRAVPPPLPSEVSPDAGSEWQRAFEKEERDESWARPLEAEIQTSLDPEINQGRFYVANVECRNTLCEIRLLARGSLQRAELDQFQSTIFQLPWAARLNPALSSGVDSGAGYEAIWIFERKPESRAAD